MNDAELRRLYGEALSRPAPSAGCPSPEALVALVLREGPEEARLVTLDHVMGCAHCLPEFELLRSMERSGAAAAPAVQPRRRWYIPVALAASILLAVAVVRRISPPDDVIRGPAGSVVLLAPGASVPSGQPLTFTWQPVPRATGYRMEVLGPDGSVVASAETSDTMVALAADRELPLVPTTGGSAPPCQAGSRCAPA